MTIVPVRITTALLTRIRARGIPVSKFLREAGEKAASENKTEREGD
jgi:post-segregation antitoxin (ccd killing protein)